jgi:adhesin transport system outer membrane protein
VTGSSAILALTLGLSACDTTDEATVSRADGALAAQQPFMLDPEMEDGSTSPIIEALLVRRSVLEPGPLRDVADAVMAANTRAAEADLRAALLRAEAQSYNWLPTLGPSVSLTSLSSVVTNLVLNAALIDHGARRAERDFAKHDVEVTAVALAEDSNSRVMQALELYIAAEAARARADVTAQAMERMNHFAYIMRERVNAGISDRADLQVVTQKQDQMASDMASDRETAASAMRELQAMAAIPVASLAGLSGLAAPSLTAEALSVMRARAESARAVASARAAQAGLLPGVSLGGSVGSDGTDFAINAGSDGIGLGIGANMRAIEAEEQAAAARVGAEREAAERAIASLEGQLQSLRRQHAEAVTLAAQATENYELFAEQQRAGQRGVTEVVGVFETKIRADRRAVGLRYDIVLAELGIAERLGLLVDGDKM